MVVTRRLLQGWEGRAAARALLPVSEGCFYSDRRPTYVPLGCSVASEEQLASTWHMVSEGALHLATTKDGVEVSSLSPSILNAGAVSLSSRLLRLVCYSVTVP